MGYFLGQHNPSNYFALTIDVHEQTGIGYFERDPAIPLPEPACAGGAVWVFTGNGKPFGESAAGAGFFNNRYGADGKSQA